VHLPKRAEIESSLEARYHATEAQISYVLAGVYTLRAIALLVPVGVVVGTVPAFELVRPVFFVIALLVLVPMVAWQVISGWVGTFDALRGKGDPVMATFLSFFVAVAWAVPRGGPSPAGRPGATQG
jgi:hypothetical protein